VEAEEKHLRGGPQAKNGHIFILVSLETRMVIHNILMLHAFCVGPEPPLSKHCHPCSAIVLH